MKVTVDAVEVELNESTRARIESVQEDYGMSNKQFIEESILRSLRFYEGLSQMFGDLRDE